MHGREVVRNLLSSLRVASLGCQPTAELINFDGNMLQARGKDLDLHLRSLNNPSIEESSKIKVVAALVYFTDKESEWRVREVLAQMENCQEETPEIRATARDSLEIMRNLHGRTKDIPYLSRGIVFDVPLGEQDTA